MEEAAKDDSSVGSPFRDSKEFHLKSPIPSERINMPQELREYNEETNETDHSVDYKSDCSLVRPTAGSFTYADYCMLESVYADSVIKNKDLIREQERITDDLETRRTQV